MSRKITNPISLLLLLALLGAALPRTVYAQDQAEGIAEVTWDEIPDLLAYVSFVVPQCPAIWEQPDPVPFPGMTLEVGKYFAWIMEQFKLLFRELVCWLLNILQHIANMLQNIINGVLMGFNALSRLIIYQWLQFRNWLFDFSAWFNALQLQIHQIVIAIAAYIAIIWELLEDIAKIIWGVIIAVVGIISWIGVLILSVFDRILGAFGSSYGRIVLDGGTTTLAAAPCPETGNTSILMGAYPHYYYVRGMLDGYRDSAIGWTFWVLVAMAYIKAIVIIARYLPSGKLESDE